MKWAYLFGLIAVVGTYVSDIWLEIDYQLAADVSLIGVATLSTVFAIQYAVRSKWWTNRIGKVYLVKSLLLALVLLQGAVATWWTDDFPGRQVIRFMIYAGGGTAYIPMLISLVREERRDRRRMT